MNKQNKLGLIAIVTLCGALMLYLLVFKNRKGNIPDVTTMQKTTVVWSNMIHDFGKIKQHTTNEFSFSFTNTGKVPLQISDAMGSCGCTVPEYPKEPVLPGESGKINVVFKPGGQENQQEKFVTVSANTNPYKTILKIRAFVQKK